jgi:hypothetical protein
MDRRIMVQVSPDINVRPYLKNTHNKTGWGVVQVVEHLPGKHKSLSPNSSTKKGRTLHINKGNNPSSRCNNCKFGVLLSHETNITGYKGKKVGTEET